MKKCEMVLIDVLNQDNSATLEGLLALIPIELWTNHVFPILDLQDQGNLALTSKGLKSLLLQALKQNTKHLNFLIKYACRWNFNNRADETLQSIQKIDFGTVSNSRKGLVVLLILTVVILGGMITLGIILRITNDNLAHELPSLYQATLDSCNLTSFNRTSSQELKMLETCNFNLSNNNSGMYIKKRQYVDETKQSEAICNQLTTYNSCNLTLCEEAANNCLSRYKAAVPMLLAFGGMLFVISAVTGPILCCFFSTHFNQSTTKATNPALGNNLTKQLTFFLPDTKLEKISIFDAARVIERKKEQLELPPPPDKYITYFKPVITKVTPPEVQSKVVDENTRLLESKK